MDRPVNPSCYKFSLVTKTINIVKNTCEKFIQTIKIYLQVQNSAVVCHRELDSTKGVTSTWKSRSTFAHGSAGEVRVHGGDVMVESSVLRVPGAGQFELLRCVGELEGSIRVSRVR